MSVNDLHKFFKRTKRHNRVAHMKTWWCERWMDVLTMLAAIVAAVTSVLQLKR